MCSAPVTVKEARKCALSSGDASEIHSFAKDCRMQMIILHSFSFTLLAILDIISLIEWTCFLIAGLSLLY